jgi:hypothetical protein
MVCGVTLAIGDRRMLIDVSHSGVSTPLGFGACLCKYL